MHEAVEVKKTAVISVVFSLVQAMLGCQNRSSALNNQDKLEENESAVRAISSNPASLAMDTEQITFIEETSRIENGFSDKENNYFQKITSITVDTNNNLYVADSGVHKIFVFDENHRYRFSFGETGQATGEFLGDLRISAGNDDRLHITDDRNWRLYAFSLFGKLIDQFAIEEYLYDVPVVSSKGEVFMLSRSGVELIDIYNPQMKLIGFLMGYDDHLDFPYLRPPQMLIKRMYFPSINDVKKLITREDELIAVSNCSQYVFHFDADKKIINKFRIEHKSFAIDYKKRLKKLASEGGWLNGFGSAFLDGKENLCLCYYNSKLGRPEIYRYTKGGLFLDTIRTQGNAENTNQIIAACDNKGNMFSVNSVLQSILIYREKDE